MKKIFLTRALLVLTVLGTFSTASPAAQVPLDKKEAEVRKFIDDFAFSLTHNDAATLDRATSGDYTFIAPNGDIQDRTQRYAPIKSGDLVYSSVTYTDVKVRIYDDTAIVTATVDVKSKLKGNDVSGKFRSTLTLIRTKGKWSLVASQANKI